MRWKIVSAVIVLVTIAMTSTTCAQSKQFKAELYNRGLELLRTQKSPDTFQLINAFESAVSVDSKTLLDPLLKEFRFKSHTLLDLFVDHVDLVAPAQMLSYLRTLNLDWDDNDTVADLAFKFGTQQTDLDQLIESLGDFFIKIEDVDDAPIPDDIALLKLRKSRIEELRYIYNLGSISSNAPLEPVEFFQQGISNPILKKHLHAAWLARIAPQIMSLEEINATIEKMDPQHLAPGALSSVLLDMDKEQLATDKVRVMVGVLIKSHLADQTGDTKEYEFDIGFTSELDSIKNFSAQPTKGDILKIVKKSEFGTEDINRIATKDGRVEEFVAATTPTNRGASPFTASGKIETDFENKLAEIPPEQQPEWIVNFVLQFGWRNRRFDLANFPDEDKILKAFELRLGDDPAIAKTISKCQGSFTPPTDASKLLLNKLMKLLPEEEQLITKFDIDSLSNRILKSGEPEFELLLKEALSMMNRPERSKEKLAAKFAFEFSMAGSRPTVVKLLEHIEDPEEKTWAYFQCAIAFPPRTARTEPMRYSKRIVGGVF